MSEEGKKDRVVAVLTLIFSAICAIAAVLAIPPASLEYIQQHLPSFAWLLARFSVPWITVLAVLLGVACGAYKLGRRKLEGTKPPRPDKLRELDLNMLRFVARVHQGVSERTLVELYHGDANMMKASLLRLVGYGLVSSYGSHYRLSNAGVKYVDDHSLMSS